MPTKKKIIKKTEPKVAKQKPLGLVSHYYGNIEVAIVKFNKPMKVGTEVCFRGATTDFCQNIASMQYDHKEISVAKKGQEVGIKVNDKVRDGDGVFDK